MSSPSKLIIQLAIQGTTMPIRHPVTTNSTTKVTSWTTPLRRATTSHSKPVILEILPPIIRNPMRLNQLIRITRWTSGCTPHRTKTWPGMRGGRDKGMRARTAGTRVWLALLYGPSYVVLWAFRLRFSSHKCLTVQLHVSLLVLIGYFFLLILLFKALDDLVFLILFIWKKQSNTCLCTTRRSSFVSSIFFSYLSLPVRWFSLI